MTDAAAPSPSSTSPGTRAWLWGRWRTERHKAADLHRRAQWLQAELENVRKQAERDRVAAQERAAEHLVRNLLPVVDSLEQALQGAKPGDPLADGLDLVRRELDKTLTAEGLSPILALGQPFDPLRHEAIRRDERPCGAGESPGLRVSEALRTGYTYRGRVLRPAIVHVVELTTAKPAGDAAPPANESPSQGV